MNDKAWFNWGYRDAAIKGHRTPEVKSTNYDRGYTAGMIAFKLQQLEELITGKEDDIILP